MVEIDYQIYSAQNELGASGCTASPNCKKMLERYQTRLLGEYIVPRIPNRGIDRHLVGAMNLRDHLTLNAVTSSLQVTHKGAGYRQLKKALRAGCTFREFEWNKHLDEIYAINVSKEVRSGGEMKPQYRKTSEELKSSEFSSPGSPSICPAHYTRSFGVFWPRELSDQHGGTLVGYINLRRQGDLGFYHQILGHGDFLNFGIMYFGHLELIRMLTSDGSYHPEIPQILFYAKWLSGGEGLQRWKKRAGFRPALILERNQ